LNLQHASTEELRQLETELSNEHQVFCQQKIKLDLTRGKPSSDQLTLADNLDGILNGNYTAADGTDTRNYGGLEGLTEARQLGADILGMKISEVLAQGNSSLTLMFYAMLIAKDFGLGQKGAATAAETAWKNTNDDIKFICPVPGYDRHFSVCEQFGIKMINVPMTDAGPDMDIVEDLIKNDSSIKGMWCVPKYSNPTGTVYSDNTVERIAKLGLIASNNFCVFWDNAYAAHDLNGYKAIANIMDLCRQHGTEDSVLQFASTSKITHAGSGVAFIGGSESNIKHFLDVLGILSIGPDKVNQLRHMRVLPNHDALLKHMEKHAELLKPRFECVLSHLNANFADNDLGEWESAEGGYFISFNTQATLAKTVVKLAGEAGVKLTPAGATFPYGNDPHNNNIRIAPSMPSLSDIDQAMKIFVNCVKLASVKKALEQK